MYIQIPKYHDNALCLCLLHGAEATAKFLLLIMVLLLRYSAAGWPALWPLRPYLEFGATGALTFTFGVYWGIWGYQPLPHLLPDHCSHWGCIMIDFIILTKFCRTSDLGAL